MEDAFTEEPPDVGKGHNEDVDEPQEGEGSLEER